MSYFFNLYQQENREKTEGRRKKEKGTYRKDFVFVFTGNLRDENLCLILSLSIKSPSPLICQINRTIKQSPKRDQALFRQHKKTEFFFSEERERLSERGCFKSSDEERER